MASIIKRLALGVVLIGLSSAVLLISDWNQRKPAANRIPRVALFVYSSQAALMEGAEGALKALEELGFIDGRTIDIVKFNGEGDVATTSTIAKQITNGRFDMVITMSTPAMQAVAGANREGKVIHVFGLVADPFAAGIGISRENPLKHPRHLIGSGIPLPVIDSFRLARRFFPGLKTVGIAWNPGEANSESFTRKARVAAKELGIELLEANADNSSAVAEAVDSVISRGAQAIWVGGDNTLLLAMGSVIAAAKKTRIPVFTIVPTDPKRGTLFDLGANFYEAGKLTGEQAAEVLRGADPATLPIKDFVPPKLVVNETVLQGLRDPWRLPENLISQADVVVDQTGIHGKTAAAAQPKPLAKKWKIGIVEYVNVMDVEEAEQGVLGGLRDAGLVEGRDYTIKIRNAQGDMATVSSLIDVALNEGADLLITLSTPTLQAALRRARNVPIVFTYLASGVAAGAGWSDEDHLPNVTGVYTLGAYEEMMAVIREVLPSVRSVGSLFVPAESNMVFHKEMLEKAGRKNGLRVVTIAANTSAEVPDAAMALMSQQIDAVCQMPGKLTAVAFPSVAAAARKSKVPIFAFQTTQARDGAVVTLARDYYESGKEASFIAARIMRGENPAKIPFMPYTKIKLIVNLESARSIGLKIPQSLAQRAAQVIGR